MVSNVCEYSYDIVVDTGMISLLAWPCTRADSDFSLLVFAQETIGNQTAVLLPINTADHWLLMVARPKEGTLEFYDSLDSVAAAQRVLKFSRLWRLAHLKPHWKCNTDMIELQWPGIKCMYRHRETYRSSVYDQWKSRRTSEKWGRTNETSLYNHV